MHIGWPQTIYSRRKLCFEDCTYQLYKDMYCQSGLFHLWPWTFLSKPAYLHSIFTKHRTKTLEKRMALEKGSPSSPAWAEESMSSSSGGLWESFCGDTSLHGYQYIGRKERRPVWIVVVLLSILAAVFFLGYNIYEYMQSFTVTTLQSTTSGLNNIFYPSITLCNHNQIRCYYS